MEFVQEKVGLVIMMLSDAQIKKAQDIIHQQIIGIGASVLSGKEKDDGTR